MMNLRSSFVIASATALIAIAGCDVSHGRPKPNSEEIAPDKVADFGILYSENCSGCHGKDGKGGAAVALADPVYLAIASDAVTRRVIANGVPGTAMPAFAQSAGGMLTDKQVDVISQGIRSSWANVSQASTADMPSYTAIASGNPERGPAVYEKFCESCHGHGGRGGAKAGSIVDHSFLALVSDQYLRTIVISGRPELGAPDWRGNAPGTSMSEQEITDVVAWLSSQRSSLPSEQQSKSKPAAKSGSANAHN
jgi:cytochrome c oxidase cbb3-type subunit III